MSTIELLAPAKDLECGIAAIHCGADAVYIGAARFGAREAAANSLRDIAALVEHAHRYWARVYAAVNTILRDDELDAAVALCRDLYGAGVDGLIVQDVGLLECDLPPLPLIASTQMHNATPARVAFLERVGFSRAILARELSLEDIRAVRAATNIELEVFVHGALCVGLSGRCALSYAIGGRSGNRGQCAQPCRRCYRLVDGAGHPPASDRHWLSLRDLDLSSHLGDLIDAGATSFKIEGRLKNKAYVMNVVGHYRRSLDAVLSGRGLRKASSGTCVLGFEPNPNKTFNRGYTSYFLHGKDPNLTSPDSPKHVGEPLGRVATVGRNCFTLEQSAPLRSGDGITFFGTDRALHGSSVNQVHGQVVYPQKVAGLATGVRVFRNHDHAFAAEVARSKPTRKIAVELRLDETADGIAISATDEDGIRATAAMACTKSPAEKPDRAEASTREHLSRWGDTELEVSRVELAWSRPLFLPASRLNGLRRALADSITRARADARPRLSRREASTDARFPEERLSFLANVLNAKAAAFYGRHGVSEIEPAAESGLDLRGRAVMTTRYCIKAELGCCPRTSAAQRTMPVAKPRGGSAPEPWALVDDEGRRFSLRFRCDEKPCVMELIVSG